MAKFPLPSRHNLNLNTIIKGQTIVPENILANVGFPSRCFRLKFWGKKYKKILNFREQETEKTLKKNIPYK